MVKCCTIVLHGDMVSLPDRGYSVRRAREEKLSVTEMTQEEEQVRSAEGLEGGESDFCNGYIYEEGRPTARPV